MAVHEPEVVVDETVAISNLVVATTAAFTGRGPGSAFTHRSGELISVLLKDILTKAERTLVDEGQAELVLSMRKAFQVVMRPRLIEGVEQITGLEVVAFMSDNHVDPDLAVETFVVRPRGAVPAPAGT